jgi:hypothetical protein
MMKYFSLFLALAFIGLMVIAEVSSDPDADPLFLGFGSGFRRGGFGLEGGGFGRGGRGRTFGFRGRVWG